MVARKVQARKVETKNQEPKTPSIPHAALNRRISLARVHDDLLFLTLLVLNLQRAAVRRYQFHLHFVKLPVVCTGRWRVRQAVLVAQKRRDALENPRNFAIKLREPGAAAGHLHNILELALALRVLNLL